MLELAPSEQLAYICHDIHNDSHKEGGRYPDAGKTPGNAEYIGRHARLLEAARAAGLEVFFTGHFLRPDYRDAVMFGNSPKYGALLDGTWGAAVIDELKPLPNEWVIRKGGGMSAFTGTPFAQWLHRCGIKQFIIAGGATHAGIESTVRSARDLDFKTVVVEDACRGGSDGHHEASIFNMSTFAQIASTDEVVEALNARAAVR